MSPEEAHAKSLKFMLDVALPVKSIISDAELNRMVEHDRELETGEYDPFPEEDQIPPDPTEW